MKEEWVERGWGGTWSEAEKEMELQKQIASRCDSCECVLFLNDEGNSGATCEEMTNQICVSVSQFDWHAPTNPQECSTHQYMSPDSVSHVIWQSKIKCRRSQAFIHMCTFPYLSLTPHFSENLFYVSAFNSMSILCCNISMSSGILETFIKNPMFIVRLLHCLLLHICFDLNVTLVCAKTDSSWAWQAGDRSKAKSADGSAGSRSMPGLGASHTGGTV